MSVFYVDLTLASGGTGISGDPFGRSNFIAHTNLVHVSDHEYLIKGTYSGPSDIILLNATESNFPTFSAWDMLTFGAWRLMCQKLVFHKSDVVQECILETNGDMLIGYQNVNSILKDANVKNTAGIMILHRAEGCSLVGTGAAKLYIGAQTQFVDTTVDHTAQIDVDESQVQLGFSSVVFQDLSFADIG